MQSRRDQLQAHTFVVGRLVSAALRAEPNEPQTPLRRFVVGTFCGLMVAVLAVAGFAIFGVVVPGGKTSWQEPGALIVEKETGARYVFVDGQLQPVLNRTSAALILGSDMRTVSVSRRSLAGVPHGLPVGIPAAPDFLPDAGKMAGTYWRACSGLQPDETGADRSYVTLRIGPTAPAAAADAVLDPGQALLVRVAGGDIYLVWSGRRLRVPGQATLATLGYGTARQYLVGTAWLNALPAGPDLAAPDVPGRGQPGPALDGRPTRVGQVLAVPSATEEQYFLVQQDGLVPLTATAAALVLGDPETATAYPDGAVSAVRLSPAGLAAAPRAPQPAAGVGLPPTPPQPVADASTDIPCVSINLGTEPAVPVQVSLSPAATAPPVENSGRDVPRVASGLVDQVLVDPGSGVLARAQPGPGVAAGTIYLLTDTGVRYPLPGKDVADALGYAEVTPVAVPGTLLSLVPTGPPLDSTAARAVVPVTPPEQVRAQPATGTLPSPKGAQQDPGGPLSPPGT